MFDPKFLESASLYSPIKLSELPNIDDSDWPAINMVCPVCNGLRTLILANTPNSMRFPRDTASDGMTYRNRFALLVYRCPDCKEHLQSFMLKFETDTVVKCGQLPGWDIDVDKAARSILGRHTATYRKGLICESQGFGVGAFAYYRQVLEATIDDLLVALADLMSDEERIGYEEALAATGAKQRVADKVKLAKQHMPAIVSPGGLNPIKTLYSELSQGIHTLSDEECLESARQVRQVYTFLLRQIDQARIEHEQKLQFERAIQDLDAKHSKRKTSNQKE